MSPLFRDPVFDGASDPVLIRNRQERSWWMLYTSRRATAPTKGVGWVHGSDVGVASSDDGGATWCYRGVLGLGHEFGRNTLWAPEVTWDNDLYHVFVSYIRGVPDQWSGHARHIHHYVSEDLVSWDHRGPLTLSSDRVIDAAVHPLPGGGYRMWYKDEDDGASTWSVDSADLEVWQSPQRVLRTPGGHEGPNVFRFRGAYWLIVDSWDGQLAYRSDDLSRWCPAGRILDTASATKSYREDDVGPGLHSDVVVDGDRAFIFYFTLPEADRSRPERLYPARRSSVLAAEIEEEAGELVCDRSQDITLKLSDAAM